jgi:uncharacterized membrane protein YqgA involved in biofilm formation
VVSSLVSYTRMRDRYGHSDQHRDGIGGGDTGHDGRRPTLRGDAGDGHACHRLVTVLVGIQSFLRFDNPLVPPVSVIVGVVIGELLGIDEALQRFGDALERRFSKGGSPVSRAFVTTSVLLLGLGLVLLSLKEVRVANMLPALVVAPLLVAAAPLWPL